MNLAAETPAPTLSPSPAPGKVEVKPAETPKTAAPGPRGAEDGPTGPCAEDIKKFCPNMKPGNNGVSNCLKQNHSKLSTWCKEQLAKASERMKMLQGKFSGLKAACEPDVERFCKNIPRGQGQRLNCLQINKTRPEFTAGCKAELEKLKKEP